MDFVDVMTRVGVALGVGLLVGMQREFAKHDDLEELFGGARTFSLIAVSGAVSAILAERADEPLILVATVLGIAGLLAVGYRTEISKGDVGLTTEIAALVTFAAGAFAGDGDLAVATAIGVITATVLAIKPFTRRLSGEIDREDVTATLKFAVVAALALPLLPNETYGPSPWNAVSPFNVGLMVVFISGLSFIGYVLIQVVGARRGIGMTGILGGLVSSTAATLTLAERSRATQRFSRALGLGVLLAWVIMFGRVLVEVGVVNPGLLPEVWLPITVGGLVAAAWAAVLYIREEDSDEDEDEDGGDRENFSNPFRLGPAIQFGLLYGVVLIGAKALDDWLGATGLYVGAIASGLADVDAITLSMSELSSNGSIDDVTAANAIVLAAASNTAVKAGIVWVTGEGAIKMAILPGAVGAIVTSVALAFLL